MRYAYFSFILILILIVAFCASCSDVTKNHRKIHDIPHTSHKEHTNKKTVLLKDKNNLEHDKKQLHKDIQNIHFD